MSITPHILVQHLTFSNHGKTPVFHDVCLSFATQKIGLVGKNGSGKTSLLRLILGELRPNSGSIRVNGDIAYLPQHLSITDDATIGDIFGVRNKILAYERIVNGSTDENDFLLLHDGWAVCDRLIKYLQGYQLNYGLMTKVKSLSGGEQTRLLLAKVFFEPVDFLLLDEPTNHLDQSGRKQLSHSISLWSKGLIIASHDRALLNQMDEIIELKSSGFSIYGGNFDDYLQQKTIHEKAVQENLQAKKQIAVKARALIQTRKERHEQNAAKGRREKKIQLRKTNSYDKIAFNAAKGRSEKTNKRILIQAERKLDYVNRELSEAKEKVEILERIDIDLSSTTVPQGKIILDIENINFKYGNTDTPLLCNFSLKMIGPERIALCGNNGSGKTTLIKLILGELQAKSGTIYLGTEHINYVDQNNDMLDPELSLLENYIQLNASATLNDAYRALAQFLFRNKTANIRIKDLSGGEKLRGLLACILMSQTPPQLLILDEPTNHLDINSVMSIESALRNYKGALIIISHDEKFVENVGIDRYIFL